MAERRTHCDDGFSDTHFGWGAASQLACITLRVCGLVRLAGCSRDTLTVQGPALYLISCSRQLPSVQVIGSMRRDKIYYCILQFDDDIHA